MNINQNTNSIKACYSNLSQNSFKKTANEHLKAKPQC